MVLFREGNPVPARSPWVPAFAGMTKKGAGMTKGGVGMTKEGDAPTATPIALTSILSQDGRGGKRGKQEGRATTRDCPYGEDVGIGRRHPHLNLPP